MSKKYINYIVSFLVIGMFTSVSVANAILINLNARTNGYSNPVSQTLNAGTYDINPTVGQYTAWNAWGYVAGCDSNGNCSNGWVNNYSFASNEIGSNTVSDGGRYVTPSLALANAIASTFTLTSQATVDFFIADYPYTDNIGGMSLDVTQRENPIPEPATMLLLSSGLFGLGIIRKKRK